MEQITQVSLLGKSQVRELCQRLNIRPTKTLGQNFVHDGATAWKIAVDAQVPAGAHVLEVGPGLGSLTLALLRAGARVTAVEIDPKLAALLPQTVRQQAGDAAKNLRILLADALEITDVTDLNAAEAVQPGTDFSAPVTHLVANLPYNVAVPILFTLLEALPTLESVLVMVQAEVAQRLAAAAGTKTYGLPTVRAQWYGKASLAAKISRNVFWPTPNVDSQLVHLEITRPYQAQEQFQAETFKAAKAAFAQRRKTLRAALAPWAGSPQAAAEICQRAGVDLKLRGEALEITDYLALAKAKVELEVNQSPQREES